MLQIYQTTEHSNLREDTGRHKQYCGGATILGNCKLLGALRLHRRLQAHVNSFPVSSSVQTAAAAGPHTSLQADVCTFVLRETSTGNLQ